MRYSAHDWSRRTSPSKLQELMDGDCRRDDLRTCLRDLAWVNKVLGGYRPILDWLAGIDLSGIHEPIRILDVGCGYGDTLRRVDAWARVRRIEVELTGLDLNPEIANIAQQASAEQRGIRWVAADVFAYRPDRPPHLIISSLMTHHLEDDQVVAFLKCMELNAQYGWAINDLSRHPTPARLFEWFARLMRLHRFVVHDGPVSFARAFVAEDWQRYVEQAGLAGAGVEVRGFTPGRLRVARIKRSGDE